MSERNSQCDKSSEGSVDVTAIIRIVGKVNFAGLRKISLLFPIAKEIILVYSGNVENFVELSSFFHDQTKIRCIRVYSFGYMEPVLTFVFKLVKTTWIMLFTENEEPSKYLISDIRELTTREVDIYLIARRSFLENDKIDSWVKDLYKVSFKPVLFKKPKIKIRDIIHMPYQLSGRIEYLDSERYYIIHKFGPDYSLSNVLEKIRRYIMIELFTTRRSRGLFLVKIAEIIGVSLKKFSVIKVGKEMSTFEYILYDLMGNIMGKYFGLTMYQKLRINAIKTLRRQNSELSKLTYSISREIYWFGSVLSYLGLENTDLIVESNNESLKGLENLESSTYAFLSMMIDRIDSSEFKFRDSPYNQMKIVERIEFILDLSIKEGLKKFK